MARAQMACRAGTWHLYVIQPGAVRWPGHAFTGASVPTVAERWQALEGLGYVFTGAPEWTWVEDAEQFGNPASPVVLIAAAHVAPAGGGAV
ncbi:hypothetical protein ADK91_21345 [Streptomyces sp. XY511]|uniref:DUF6303 family protein n=1 Tax=Streptomyces sp. XY511 TaxID=1519480 RepID=UPI0006C11C76|nr:DUF6303 family protein [Streptomyces sp. XY511]KOV02023.1 hypothetical protein ADK91_21345 [Streptomyces sp. XY511]